jgi:hypothetical protein
MKKRIQDILDGDVPDDVPQWIVEFHDENDDPNMTPLQVARRAFQEIQSGHSCKVCHVRSGLKWSINLKTGEWFEVAELKMPCDLPGIAPWKEVR